MSERKKPVTQETSHAENPKVGFDDGDLLPPSQVINGVPPEAPKAQPIRKSWSSPIQTMARIEQLMNDLDEKQRRIVGSWFFSTYLQGASDGKQL